MYVAKLGRVSARTGDIVTYELWSISIDNSDDDYMECQLLPFIFIVL